MRRDRAGASTIKGWMVHLIVAAADPKANVVTRDRRRGVDRRQVDKGPPGKHDRRQNLESRQPEVVELDLSNSAWIALLEEPPKL
jgi:hypothetical protein